MTTKLTPAQIHALHAGGDAPLPMVDPETNAIYYLVDRELLASLRAVSDLRAIESGISDVRAGRTMSLEESKSRTLQSLKDDITE